jgi:hypothetical protein
MAPVAGGHWRSMVLRVPVQRPWVLTALLCAALMVLPLTGPDLAAQEFRTWLFRSHGALLWEDQWYSGHLLSGYSLLFPPLASVVGTRLLGSIACVWAAAAASALLGGAQAGRGHRLAGVWFAVAFVGELVQGQLPFVVGLALALTALLAAHRDHRWSAAVAALATSLTSPLAGGFLLLVGLAWLTEAGLRRTAPLASAGVGVLVGALLGGGGYFPFPLISLLVVLLFAVGGLLLAPRMPRSLRWGLLLYGISSAVLFAVPNPAGGNAARLGSLAGGPLAALALGNQGRWRTLTAVAVPLLLWQGWPVATAVSHAVHDPSSQPTYYTGLQAFLRTQQPTQGRLEIPTLRQHWEASYVAPFFPLARGWERQLDLQYNAPLYDDSLTAGQLHQWMISSGVSLVALPDAPLDPWSVQEGAIIAAGQPWLVPVWHDAHWRVWRVADAPGMVTGPAQLTRLGIESFALQVDQPGAVLVRLHWSPYWQVTQGEACLRPSPDDWVIVEALEPGQVSVDAQWSLARMADRDAAPCGALPQTSDSGPHQL